MLSFIPVIFRQRIRLPGGGSSRRRGEQRDNGEQLRGEQSGDHDEGDDGVAKEFSHGNSFLGAEGFWDVNPLDEKFGVTAPG
jgi:hypothetical protein